VNELWTVDLRSQHHDDGCFFGLCVLLCFVWLGSGSGAGVRGGEGEVLHGPGVARTPGTPGGREAGGQLPAAHRPESARRSVPVSPHTVDLLDIHVNADI